MKYCYAFRRFSDYPYLGNAFDMDPERITSKFLSRVKDMGFDGIELGIECLEKIMPDRSISICKELTKVNEFVFRGVSSKIKRDISRDEKNLKGEFVAVIDRQTLINHDIEEISLYKKELKKMTSKFSLTDTVEIVHKFTKINKNKIYKWLLNLKKN